MSARRVVASAASVFVSTLIAIIAIIAIIALTTLTTLHAHAQPSSNSARRFLPSTFANLAAPNAGDVRWCTDCSISAPCTGGGSGAYAFRTGSVWNCTNGGGDVTGPASSTDNAIVRFSGTTGGLLKNSTVIVTDIGLIQAGDDGAVGNSALSFVNEPNLGLFRRGAGQLGVRNTSAGTVGWFDAAGYHASGTTIDAFNQVGATSTDGVVVESNGSATVGAQEWSPRLHFKGSGWKTDATAGAQSVDWIVETQPVQGTAAPTSLLVFSSSVNGGAYASRVSVTSAGAMTVSSFVGALTGNSSTATALQNARTINGDSFDGTANIQNTLASADFANQGTTTTVYHGNAAGNPSWGAVVSADLNVTTTTCSNQFLTALSSSLAGTCTTATLAGAQFANQGTTTTVLHGNGAGNPSFGQIVAGDVTPATGSGSFVFSQSAALTGLVTINAASTGAGLTAGPGGTGTTSQEIQVNAGSGSGGHSVFSLYRNSVLKARYAIAGVANAFFTGDAADDLDIQASQKINIGIGSTIRMTVDSNTTGQCTLNGAATATCTHTVSSGCIPVCTYNSATTPHTIACSVTTTTLTAVSATTLDGGVVNYHCF